jgi:hypothetical protein
LNKGIKAKEELTAAGKTAEEVMAGIGEAFKYEGDKLKHFVNAIECAIANPEKQAGIKTFSLLDWIGGGLGKKKAKIQPTAKAVVEAVTPVETTESLTETPVEMVETEIAESVLLFHLILILGGYDKCKV